MMRKVVVWDLPTRLFHWILVGLVVLMWYTGHVGGDWLRYHIWCGEAVAVLLVFRLLWGVFGSQTARFSDFLKSPKTIRRYLAGEVSEAALPGHNPLGGWMVLCMLLVLLFQVATGLFASDVDSYLYDGPLAHRITSSLSETMTAIHKLSFDLILALVGLHLCAIFAYRVFKKQKLVRAMLSGRKELEGEVEPLFFAPLGLALASLVLSACLVVAIVLGVGAA
jgi:cytochrome b